MKIWVDADACPLVVKEILYRAAERRKIEIFLVANSYLRTPPSRLIKFLKVPSGFDNADEEIVKRVVAGDLVVTADIPLAAAVLEKKCLALSPRGEVFSSETIGERLAIRDLMSTLRSSGVKTGGPSVLSQTDRQKFANKLDVMLNR
tara:strand:- start:176 stop:616 length:441 start_codon:yes stop_codon:yes gene_type:complete